MDGARRPRCPHVTTAGLWLLPPYPGLYERLGVSPDAEPEDIKRAFWALSREHHPDANGQDAGTRYREITEAWTILKDPEQRHEYDTVAVSRDSAAEVNLDDWDDDDSSIPTPARGADVTIKRTISTADARRGTILYVHEVRKERHIDVQVRIPAGIADGTTMRVSGKGGRGLLGGPSGDLLIAVTVGAPQRGEDWHVKHTINEWEAARGTTIKVTRPGAPKRRTKDSVLSQYDVLVKVPPGVASGRVVRARGKGHPGSNGGPAGDLFVTLTVVNPERGADIHLLHVYPAGLTDASVTLNLPIQRRTWKKDGSGGAGRSTTVRVRFPQDVRDGDVITVAGKGHPGRWGGSPGDVLVTVRLEGTRRGATHHVLCRLTEEQYASLQRGRRTEVTVTGLDGRGSRQLTIALAEPGGLPDGRVNFTQKFPGAWPAPDTHTEPGDVYIDFKVPPGESTRRPVTSPGQERATTSGSLPPQIVRAQVQQAVIARQMQVLEQQMKQDARDFVTQVLWWGVALGALWILSMLTD